MIVILNPKFKFWCHSVSDFILTTLSVGRSESEGRTDHMPSYARLRKQSPIHFIPKATFFSSSVIQKLTSIDPGVQR